MFSSLVTNRKLHF